MLALAEPCITFELLDRPHLGCAMLIAACLEKKEKVTLIKGQTRYLKDMFINDSEELWNLIHDLKKDDLKKIGIDGYKKIIQENGLRQFQAELKSLYQYVIIDKNPRHYFNGLLIDKFNYLHLVFMSVYEYYFSELHHSNLRIIDRYISEILKSNPRYIGFSLQGVFEPLSRTIRKRIKELTGVPIIVGGALTPFIDFKKLNKTFEEEYFDYLVVGAGEVALPSLIEALDNNKEPKGIANVFYKKDGKIKTNDLEVINDLDSLPYPDYSQFDLDLYLPPKKILPLQTARGCSWRKCTFCSHHEIYRGNYKAFSIETIIKTIKHLQNTYGCSHFTFYDEELPPGQAKRISEAILDNNLRDISIYTYARLVDGYNSDLLHLMRKAGFTLIYWGMESGCQRVLDLMNKGTKLSTMSQILKKSSRNKIANHCFILLGFPGETEEEAQQTIEFLKKHADYIEGITISKFILEPYSIIGRNPEKWGVDIKEKETYSTRTGMSSNDCQAFYSKLDVKLRFNSIKLTSDKLKFILPGHNLRMFHFLNFSHRLLSKAFILEHLEKDKLNSIFPIILGEMKTKANKNIFRPINIKEPIFINKRFPEKEIALDKLQKEIFILCDGTLSADEICLAIYRDFKRKYSKKYIHKKCRDFLRELFFGNWGLCFAKSWKSL